MTNPHRILIGPAGARIALARWGEDGSHKPPALLSHGTGFVAEVWDDIARELVSRPSMRSTAAAMVTATSLPLTAITSWILPRTSAP